MVTKISPMNAHHCDLNRVEYPVFLQPKYDGKRRMYSPSLGGWSRIGTDDREGTTEHLNFNYDCHQAILDGEVMLDHDRYSFQESMSACQRAHHPLARHLRYFVFDCYVRERPNMTFENRFQLVSNLINMDHVPDNVMVAPTYKVYSESDLLLRHEEFLSEGYEGSMVRVPNSPYEIGKRSRYVTKLKKWSEDEFEIIEVNQGIGKDAGHAMFKCKTPSGQTFDVRPADTYHVRAEQFVRRDELLGKMLTVRYVILTERGVPRDPRGKGVRNYE